MTVDEPSGGPTDTVKPGVTSGPQLGFIWTLVERLDDRTECHGHCRAGAWNVGEYRSIWASPTRGRRSASRSDGPLRHQPHAGPGGPPPLRGGTAFRCRSLR